MATVREAPDDSGADDAAWEKRITFYGLSPKDAAREPVVVNEGERVNLMPAKDGGSRFSERVKRVPVQSIRDLKRLIGTPDEVIRSHGCGCDDLPSESVAPSFKSFYELDAIQQRALYAASKAYLYGDSSRVSHFEPVLDHAYALDKRRFISVMLLQDLIVERNATVTLGGNINVALFRKIYIKQKGKLRITKNLKIDCVSIEGEGFLNSQIFDRDIFSTAVAGRCNP